MQLHQQGKIKMKIVINRCYGGFSLSEEAFERYLELKGITWYKFKSKYNSTMYSTVPQEEYAVGNDQYLSNINMSRGDPILVRVVEEMRDKANGGYAELKVVKIPDGVEWEIEEYDGMEWVAETHRTWS